MRLKFLLLAGTAAVLFLTPHQGYGVDAYSQRCDWCVTAGFWENVIRGNDKCLDYVSDDLKGDIARMSATFRSKMTNKCGRSYHDGHVESTFSFQRLGPRPDGTFEVRVYGEATTNCRGRKPFLKEDFTVTSRPRKDTYGLWEVVRIEYEPQ